MLVSLKSLKSNPGGCLRDFINSRAPQKAKVFKFRIDDSICCLWLPMCGICFCFNICFLSSRRADVQDISLFVGVETVHQVCCLWLGCYRFLL